MGWIGTEFGARWSVAAGGTIVLLIGLCSVIVVSRNRRCGRNFGLCSFGSAHATDGVGPEAAGQAERIGRAFTAARHMTLLRSTTTACKKPYDGGDFRRRTFCL
jgi:hypothetical protein